jgi:hypothetical protein
MNYCDDGNGRGHGYGYNTGHGHGYGHGYRNYYGARDAGYGETPDCWCFRLVAVLGTKMCYVGRRFGYSYGSGFR